MEDARILFTTYITLTTLRCPETRATFGYGVTCKGLMVDGSFFNSVTMLLLTFLGTGFLTKRVLESLASDTGSEIGTCMLLLSKEGMC